MDFFELFLDDFKGCFLPDKPDNQFVNEFIIDYLLKKSIIDPTINQLKRFQNVYFLTSAKANTERIYRNYSSEFELNELIIRHEELNLGIKKAYSIITEAMKIFEMGTDYSIERSQGVVSQIKILKNKSDTNGRLLADLGFGFTQLFTIFLKTAIIIEERYNIHRSEFEESVLFLEEPESNLHPKFQSKLADFFVHAAELYNIQFIVETHSEYLIRKLQYFVASKKLNTIDVAIFYFNQNSLPEAFEILENGTLNKNFPSGFFDEDIIWLKLADAENQIGDKTIDCLAFTEDGNTKMFESLLEANGFKMDKTQIISFDSKDNIEHAIFMAQKLIENRKSIKKVIIYTDSDVFNKEDKEITLLSKINSAGIKDITHLIYSPNYDMESSYFLNEKHIYSCNSHLNSHKICDLIEQKRIENYEISIKKIKEAYKKRFEQNGNKKVTEERILEKAEVLYHSNPLKYSYGKKLLYKIQEYYKLELNIELDIYKPTEHLKKEEFESIAKSIWPKIEEIK